MTTTVTAKIQWRRGTAAQWTNTNPILLQGEVGYEIDTGKQKAGDGFTAWNDRDYYYDPNDSGGVTDHGELAGLSDDDHTQYHTNSRGDARYSALAHTHSGVYESSGAVATHSAGSGVHEIAGVTGLQTALDGKSSTSHDHSATYAPIANGVTNGDSHDHSGSDGAQIAYSGLSGLPTLGTAAAQNTGAFEASGAVSTHAALTTTHGISSFGASLVDDANASAAHTTLGLGTAATTAATDYATAAQGAKADSALQIATPLVINDQTGTTYTFVLADAGKVVRGSNASAITITIPLDSAVAFAVGTQIAVEQLGAGQISIAPYSGVTLNSRSSMRKLSAQYAGAALLKTATDTWWLEGSLSA
jgi:hypothetical protein